MGQRIYNYLGDEQRNPYTDPSTPWERVGIDWSRSTDHSLRVTLGGDDLYIVVTGTFAHTGDILTVALVDGYEMRYLDGRLNKQVFFDSPVDYLKGGLGANPQQWFSGDDVYIFSESLVGDDVLYVWGGSDTIQPSGGDDYVNGGDGIDTLMLFGKREDYQVSKVHETLTVRDSRGASRDGTDTLNNLERIEFSDGRYAFDMDGHAGSVAKILGAVFGPSYLLNAEYVGIGLGLLDDGMSYEQLLELALSARLGPDYTTEQLVNLLELNVYGNTDTGRYVAYWSNHANSSVDIAANYCQSGGNLGNIDLVGLSTAGLRYV